MTGSTKIGVSIYGSFYGSQDISDITAPDAILVDIAAVDSVLVNNNIELEQNRQKVHQQATADYKELVRQETRRFDNQIKASKERAKDYRERYEQSGKESDLASAEWLEIGKPAAIQKEKTKAFRKAVL